MNNFTYNHVILIGECGKTPELHETKSGTKVVNFSISTLEIWKDQVSKEPKKKRRFHRLVAWGKMAESIVAIVKEGDIISIEGELSYRKVMKENSNEKPTYITEIKISKFEKKYNSIKASYISTEVNNQTNLTAKTL